MKKIIVIIVLTSLFTACNNYGGGSYTLTGNAKGLKDGTKIILQKQSEDGKSAVGVDTVLVKGEKFEIKGKVDETEIFGLLVENNPQMANVVLEKGTITIDIYKDSIYKSVAKGTFNNDQFQNFNAGIIKLQESIKKRMNDFELAHQAEMKQAQLTSDTATINKLRTDYGAIRNELTDYAVKFSKKNPKAYISLLIVQGLFNNGEYKFEDVKKRFEALDSDIKGLKAGKKIQEMLDTVAATEIGKKAPNFTAKDPKGKDISLSDSMGKKATIIDFWASWCMPCRQENPKLVALYKEFHDKGLNIVGVSLDNDSKEWITAIAKDQLIWPHVSNLKTWEQNPEIAKQYSVNSIPATFLLDADGKIVAKNINGAELRKKVMELMKK